MNRLTLFAFLFIGLSQGAITRDVPQNARLPFGDTPQYSTREETTLPVAGSDQLPDVDEWIFLPKADTGLSFESLVAKDLFILPADSIKGRFTVTVSGETPVRSAVPDAIAAAKSNRFSLRMQGYVRDVVLVGADFPVAVLSQVKGVLKMSDGRKSWKLTVSQENFGIMGATLQVNREQKRARAYVPLVIAHEPSGLKLHAQLYLLFAGTEGNNLTPVPGKMAFRLTPDAHTGLGYAARLADLFTSPPKRSGELAISQSPALQSATRFRAGHVRIANEGQGIAMPFGNLTNWPLVESALCTQGAVLAACTDEGSQQGSVGMRLSGRATMPGAADLESPNWSVSIDIHPGASTKNSDGAIVNYIEHFSGTLQVGPQAFEIAHANVSDTVPTSRYDQSTGLILFTLPSRIGIPGSPQVRAILSATCLARGALSHCTSAVLADAEDSFGRSLGDKSIADLANTFMGQSENPQSSEPSRGGEALPPVEPDANPGCAFLCPRCLGVAQDCPNGTAGGFICGSVSTTQCPPGVASTCCQSNFRSACRSCTPGGGGGGGCQGSSTETLVYRLGESANSLPAERIQVSNCAPVTLETQRRYSSRLKAAIDDWTLLRFGDGATQVLRTSHAKHANDRLQCLPLSRSGTYLAIDHAQHQAGARPIEHPRVALNSGRIAASFAGRLVAQLEYDDRGIFIRGELIHSEPRIEDAARLLGEIESAIGLTYSSVERHALTVYAFIARPDPSATLSTQFVVTVPTCCPCPPPPYLCP